MSTATEADQSRRPGGGRRLLRGDPGLALRLARSLLAERRRLPGDERRRLPRRRLLGPGGARELVKHGGGLDPDLAFRTLAHVIDPDWTRGQRFSVAYELTGEGGGTWIVRVAGGRVRVESPGENGAGSRNGAQRPDSVVRLSVDSWLRVVAGDVRPADAIRLGLTEVRGALPPVTLLGRWIDRAEGLDGPELQREARQREVQARRAGSWGGSAGNGGGPRGSSLQVDPAHRSAARARAGDLMTYEQLYALWERSNWRAHELDFSVDREHWVATPTEAQEDTIWSLGSFYVGEERVAADLAPFVLAAPTGEAEAFLATQLVDETRHAVFFDRFAAEVMALSADDLRGRMSEIERTMLRPWHFLFDDSLRDVAQRIAARPDDLELFVEGVVIYHMVTEGVLAMTGQRTILQYLSDHDLFPGFQQGFSLVEQDEHRHIAFGVRFLRDVCDERPEMRGRILDILTRLLPRAAEVFAPPYAGTDPSDFQSYGFHSSQVYGHAYMALKRRMRVVGVEIPPPEELMPGPIDPNGLAGARRDLAAA